MPRWTVRLLIESTHAVTVEAADAEAAAERANEVASSETEKHQEMVECEVCPEADTAPLSPILPGATAFALQQQRDKLALRNAELVLGFAQVRALCDDPDGDDYHTANKIEQIISDLID